MIKVWSWIFFDSNFLLETCWIWLFSCNLDHHHHPHPHIPITSLTMRKACCVWQCGRGSRLRPDCPSEIRPSYMVSGGSCPYFGLPTPAAMPCEWQRATAWNTIPLLTSYIHRLHKQSHDLEHTRIVLLKTPRSHYPARRPSGPCHFTVRVDSTDGDNSKAQLTGEG